MNIMNTLPAKQNTASSPKTSLQVVLQDNLQDKTKKKCGSVSARTFSTRVDSMRGFSMIEVLVAILIVSVGLIGLALLQSMALKYSQSSQYRTQAVNLSSNLLEQIRANRAEANSYVGTFTAANSNCAATGTNVSTSSFMNEWRCQMRDQLGAGAQAVVSKTNNQVQVQITWADSWWETSAAAKKYTHTAATEI